MPRCGELLRAACLLAALTPFQGGLPPPEERIELRPGATYLRFLTTLGPHTFHFSSPAGRLLRLDVDQRGVDVAVLLFDPAGKRLYEVDSDIGRFGPEPVETVTPLAGDYRLVIEPAGSALSRNQGFFALEVHENRPATPQERIHATAMTFWARAERRRSQHRLPEAANIYRAALPLLERAGEPRRRAAAEWNLGRALLQTGDLSEAARRLESAAVDYRRLYDSFVAAPRFEGPPSRESCRVAESKEAGLSEAWASNDLAEAELYLGQTGKALAARRRALAVYRERRTTENACACDEGTATTLTGIGIVLMAEGNFQGAMEQFEAALQLWERAVGLGHDDALAARAITRQNLGSLYSLLGRDDESFDELDTALKDLKQSGKRDPKKQMEIRIAFGQAEFLAGHPEPALTHYEAALELAHQTGSRLSEAAIIDRRASALKALKRYHEAEESYHKSSEMSHAAHNFLSEGNTLANLGWLALEAGGAEARIPDRQAHVEEALAFFEKALDFVTGRDSNAEVYTLVGLSRAERLSGRLDAARKHAEAAVGKIQKLRAGLRGPESRATLLATRFQAYEELATILMELESREPGQGHAEEALEIAEQGRARGLIEELTGGKMTPVQKSLEAGVQLLSKRREEIADVNPQDPRLPEIEANLRQQEAELDQLTSTSASGAGIAPLKAGEIQSLADEDSLLIVYLLAEPESFAWTVDRGGVVSHRHLPGRGQIEDLAHQAVDGLASGLMTAADAPVVTALHQLSQAIMAPLADRLHGKRNLVFLPDGALHLLPFGVLPAPASPAAHPGEGCGCLLDEHTISILPSATLLHWQRERLARRPAPPKVVAVLAEPLPSPGAGALPSTKDEASAIAALVPHEKALIARGAAANKELVKSGALREFGILHFAVHGHSDPVLPERSGLILSPQDPQGRPVDPVLTAPEVAELDLPAELAVLSGCETGRGRELRGEGTIGLPQAFFRAGTRRVIATTWSVRDQPAAELMGHFYRGRLSGGLSAAEALRAAQLEMRRSKSWCSPYFWAGYSLYGDWQ